MGNWGYDPYKWSYKTHPCRWIFQHILLKHTKNQGEVVLYDYHYLAGP